MFKFNFSDVELEDDENPTGADDACTKASAPKEAYSGSLGATSRGCKSVSEICDNEDSIMHASNDEKYVEAHELAWEELAQSLPPAFSYSPLVIPISVNSTSSLADSALETQQQKAKATSVVLLRRDLFDVRYQLISESSDARDLLGNTARSSDEALPGQSERNAEVHDAADALKFIDNPSDLVPGVYEGGLKTWECALDFVDCLTELASERNNSVDRLRGKRVLEIGCGTAVPSLYLLHTLFSYPQAAGVNSEPPWAEFVLQDYNELVLRLVTFPNVLLQWYASPLAEAYRSQHAVEDDGNFDPTAPGDLQVTPDLLSAFRASLQEQHVSIRFISGSWQSFNDDRSPCTFPFDITLTSETIYQTSSLPSLIALLRRSTPDNAATSVQTGSLSLEGNGRLCLVAAKVLYFGVGGGVMEFERAVREAGGKISTVLERKVGVGRKVLRVQWL